MKRARLLCLAWIVGCGGASPGASSAASTSEVSGGEAPVSARHASDLASAELPDPCGGGRTASFHEGTAEAPSTIGLDEPSTAELTPIGEADLDGDGRVELVAYVVCMPGGSGTFDSVRAYHDEHGAFVEVAILEGGDRADGGLDGARIVQSDVVVGRYSGDEEGVCCPTHVTEETWHLAGGAFTRTHVGATQPVPQ